jgi:acyl-CoA dehydrogenase
LPYERAVIALTAACTMERAVELTIAYTKERKAFGQPVFEFQNSRFKLAELATQARVARVFMDFVIAERIAGRLDDTTASMAKWWTTQGACDVVDECLQLFGGAGYMNEYPIARLYADVRVMKIFGGANEIMKDLIARSL